MSDDDDMIGHEVDAVLDDVMPPNRIELKLTCGWDDERAEGWLRRYWDGDRLAAVLELQQALVEVLGELDGQ